MKVYRATSVVITINGVDVTNVVDMPVDMRGHTSSPEHPQAKFSARQVRRIRREFARGNISARAIARRLGVAPATIVNMVARRSYWEVK